jgi:hypothetical protein
MCGVNGSARRRLPAKSKVFRQVFTCRIRRKLMIGAIYPVPVPIEGTIPSLIPAETSTVNLGFLGRLRDETEA